MPCFRHRISALFVSGCIALTVSTFQTSARQTQQAPSPATSAAPKAVFEQYCITCHNQKLHTAGLELDSLDPTNPGPNAEVLEKVIAKLRAGSMPPPGRPRPDAATYHAVAGWLETEIDRAWIANPNPGRISAVHRLNRTEYGNAVRDLFALDPLSFDVKSLLPGDETADGSFDNFADALSISTAHLERYLSVARQVTRLAIGLPPSSPRVETFEIPLHVVQDERQSEDLPFGSRGGAAIHHDFPVAGEYLIKVRLQRQYQDYIKGMGWPQTLDVRLDGKLVKRFSVGGKAQGRPAAASYAGDGEPGFAGDDSWEKYMQIGGDAGLEVRVTVEAGPHVVGVSFVRELWEPEGLPQPLQRGRVLTDDELYMDYASVGSVQIGGPFESSFATAPSAVRLRRDAASAFADAASADESARQTSRAIEVAGSPRRSSPEGRAKSGRRAIFVCQPRSRVDERTCAAKILARLAHLAYRRPVLEADTDMLLEFFDKGRTEGGSFDDGVQFALERMLVDPDFLLRVHRPHPGHDDAAPLSDIELASRLSFFLWSSIPDERLLDLAEHRQLSKPEVLEQEVRRMLADRRATDALVGVFAAQWLNPRRVSEVVVHPDPYPDFDDRLL